MVINKVLDISERELGETFDSEVLTEGSNTVIRLCSEDDSYILKIFDNEGSNKEMWFRAEPLIYQLLNKKSEVKAPNIKYIGFNNKPSFYIMEEVEGENPDILKDQLSAQSLENLLYQYGKILGKTHETTTFSHYGILGERNGELKVTEKRVRWPWSIWGTLRVWEDKIMNGWENPPEKELLPDKEYVEKTLPAKPESVIIHDDNSFENLKVEYATIEALLDWAHTRAGHGEYDLIKAEYSLIDWYLRQNSADKNRLRKALYKGYRKHREIKEDGFKQRKKLYRYFTVIWLCAGFPNWSSEMDEEQRNRIREDLINRLEKEKPS